MKIYGLDSLANSQRTPQSSIKEIFRFIQRQVLAGWKNHIGNSLSYLLTEAERMRGLSVAFEGGFGFDSLDERAATQWAKDMKISGILSVNDVRRTFGYKPVPGQDKLQETKIETEVLKQEGKPDAEKNL